MSDMREHLGSQASTVMRQYADHLLYDGNLTETDIEGFDEALEAAKQVIEAVETIKTIRANSSKVRADRS
jgi:hypothetical protein